MPLEAVGLFVELPTGKKTASVEITSKVTLADVELTTTPVETTNGLSIDIRFYLKEATN
jgi:hypothetical protein